MSKISKILIVLLVGVTIKFLYGFGYVYYKFNSIYKDQDDKHLEDYTYMNKDTLNILLVGVDGDNLDKGNRSDSIIILTIDNKNNDIRLTSIWRDTFVFIPGYSTEKLNHSYAYEGPTLLMQTINDNFGISIDKYITVNFEAFIKIIDAIGGVEVNIDEKNLKYINEIMYSTYSVYSSNSQVEPMKLIESSGNQIINGYQALAFSRIRHGDNGYSRDGRQREVIISAYEKLQKENLKTINESVNILFKRCKTNIAPLEMMKIVTKVYNIKDKSIDQLEFPIASHRRDEIEGSKGWVTKWDKEYNKAILSSFIYEHNKYEQTKSN
ncbi:LCP family protein [Romboutsia sp.]|uniref:LCP family protein n=1 Tax=Romboutsia sp. TaxID=1965302 RepID=UPI003F34642F